MRTSRPLFALGWFEVCELSLMHVVALQVRIPHYIVGRLESGGQRPVEERHRLSKSYVVQWLANNQLETDAQARSSTGRSPLRFAPGGMRR